MALHSSVMKCIDFPSAGFQEICCSSTNPERALGQFLRSRGSDVGPNELVMRHILGALAAPSSAAMSSPSAIRNKVCDTALYPKSATRQKRLICTERTETPDLQSVDKFFFFMTRNL